MATAHFDAASQVDRATSETLLDVDWGMNLNIVDRANESQRCVACGLQLRARRPRGCRFTRARCHTRPPLLCSAAEDVMKALCRRMGNANPKIVQLSLAVRCRERP